MLPEVEIWKNNQFYQFLIFHKFSIPFIMLPNIEKFEHEIHQSDKS